MNIMSVLGLEPQVKGRRCTVSHHCMEVALKLQDKRELFSECRQMDRSVQEQPWDLPLTHQREEQEPVQGTFSGNLRV